MSSQPTVQELMAEAIAFGMDFSTPTTDTTPIEELKTTLEIWSAQIQQANSPPAISPPVISPLVKPTSLELLEAASTCLTSVPEDNECAICITELVIAASGSEANMANAHQTGTAIKLNTCGHVFHSGCLLQWLKSANTCPFCRRRVCDGDTKEEEDAEEVFEEQRAFWWGF